jgi:hypothetical protein
MYLLLPLAELSSSRKVCAEERHDAVDDLSKMGVSTRSSE